MCIANNSPKWNEAKMNQPAANLSGVQRIGAVLALAARRKQMGLTDASPTSPGLGSAPNGGGGLGG